MPQIKLPLIAIFIAAGLTLSGCGDKNNNAIFTQETAHKAQSDWAHTHKTTARADLDSCSECHGPAYNGGISQISCGKQTAVNGFTCHFTTPIANTTECVSCHGGLSNGPVGPFGDIAPNTKAAHTTHITLLTPLLTPGDPTGKTVCDTCHLGAGAGTAEHARATSAGGRNRATLRGSDTAIVFNDTGATTTCSSVSCHGGQTTPAWTGSIKIVAGNKDICLMCHGPRTNTGTQQYNSYFSGEHTFHINKGLQCTGCHNISALTNYEQHFSGIIAKKFTSPGLTVGNKGDKDSKATQIGFFDDNNKTCSTVTCHAGTPIPDGVRWNQ